MFIITSKFSDLIRWSAEGNSQKLMILAVERVVVAQNLKKRKRFSKLKTEDNGSEEDNFLLCVPYPLPRKSFLLISKTQKAFFFLIKMQKAVNVKKFLFNASNSRYSLNFVIKKQRRYLFIQVFYQNHELWLTK